ncbi:MAG: hypothetical protein M2R45_04264 [Verrucomicrobia subdivision 3 bacterium]|nr:hypothetical protein [Limisphaerales bacterium]
MTPEALARAWLRAIKFLSVIALVGEASGYQRILREAPRERLSLRNSSPPGLSLGRCPSGFIGSRLGAWFGVRETKRPSVMGPCINHAVCECLNPGVPEELRHRSLVMPEVESVGLKFNGESEDSLVLQHAGVCAMSVGGWVRRLAAAKSMRVPSSGAMLPKGSS